MLLQLQFSQYVNKTHTLVKQGDRDYSVCNGIPRHKIILESLIESKEGVRSEVFHKQVIDNYGDADVSNGTRRIDPALKFYSGIPFMMNTNKEIKKGKANGTLRRGISIKLKTNKQLNWKNWDGRKVLFVYINNVGYMLCEHWKVRVLLLGKYSRYILKHILLK